MYDFNAGRDKRHQEREKSFGEKPFTFGRIDGEPAEFYVRANVGYLGIKRVAALSEESTGGETFEAIEASVFSMIDTENDALERFKAVVNNNDDPITFDDLVELQNWLLQEQSALPPTEPEPSAGSSTTSGKKSTAA
jgi:hypothetical protein